MLGWFAVKKETSVEDIEWLMAKSAGYNAGFAFFAKLPDLEKNPNTEEILNIVKTWEKLRLSDKFTPQQKSLLKDVTKEFKLVEVESNRLNLSVVQYLKFSHAKKILQPGEPTYSEKNSRMKLKRNH